jgi:predicted acylesterase/phospholipase RssA
MADATDTGPYLGPQPFGHDDRSRFFGRGEELEQLHTMVLSNVVVVLYAGSGAGKTSLLKAGLLPLLEEQEEFQVLPTARVTGAEQDEGDGNPFVRSVIASWLKEDEEPPGELTLAEYLARVPHPDAHDGWEAPRVIVIDQLEEIFTLRPHHWVQRNEFFEQLAEALSKDPLLRVVLAIREDYMYELEPQRVRVPGRLRARFRLDLLSEPAALDAIVKPLEDTERAFAPGVAKQLVKNLRTTGGAGGGAPLAELVEPVQLQVTCASLWQALPADRSEITVSDLKHFGDVEQALRSLYDLAIARAAVEAGWWERNLREEFATAFITSIDTRGTAYRTDQGVGGMPWAAIKVLESHHIIRAEWRSKAHWYELTHDRFIGPIRRSNRRFVLNDVTGIHEGERAVPVLLTKKPKGLEKLPRRHRGTSAHKPGPAPPPSPVADERVEKGIALCLTGGGYRSMLFAAGALWRLNDAGLLPRLDQISSNSSAAVTAALAGLGWERMEFDREGRGTRFEETVVKPLRELASVTLDTRLMVTGLLSSGRGNEKLVEHYEERLFGSAPLGQLPDRPRFVFTCSHLASGELWRFSKQALGNERVGWIERPETKVAVAVAASGAIPPVHSPAVLENGGGDAIVLTSGSLYDTLAIETAWRRYDTVLACDGKGSRPIAHAARMVLNHYVDFVAASDTELHRLRRQQALLAYTSGIKKGGYWGINSAVTSFPVETTLPCPPEETAKLAALPARLARLDESRQEQLINWGFAITDAALRSHFDHRIEAAGAFPYPAAGVG